MALGDFTILEQASMTGRGSRLYNVAAGTPILAGEPVQKVAVGDITVVPMFGSARPVVGTSGVEGLFVGIAQTNSTNTTTAAGTVNVFPVNSDTTWLCAPAVAASWDTQAEYDALVGKRVLIQNGAYLITPLGVNTNIGTYSILASDSAANGVVVMAMPIGNNSGKVAVAFRTRTSNMS